MARQQHHHRSTTKVAHKAFKSRHASKSSLREKAKGRIDQTTSLSTASGPSAVRKSRNSKANGLNKQARRNKAKQLRLSANKALASERSLFAGRNGAPVIVSVVPLCGNVGKLDLSNLTQGDFVVKSLLDAVASPGENILESVVVAGASRIVRVERFGRNVAFVVPERNLFSVLDACRVSDYVLFVLSPEEPVDRLGEAMIRAIEAQGLSEVVAAVLPPADAHSVKERKRIDSSLKSFLDHFFPDIERLPWLDVPQECVNLIRSICSSLPRGVRWRDERSWMLVEEVEWPTNAPENDENAKGEVVITGVIRGTPLNPNRLIQVGDWGDFQVEKVCKAPSRFPVRSALKSGSHQVTLGEIDVNEAIAAPTEEQDDLLSLAPEEMVDDDEDERMTTMTSTTNKGVLLDDHYYFSDEDEEERRGPRRLPRGTSKYQSAWYLDDLSDGSDIEEIDFDASSSSSEEEEDKYEEARSDDGMDTGEPGPSSGLDRLDARTVHFAPSTVAETDFGDDAAAAAQPVNSDAVAAYRAERKRVADEDAEFPDEIELHPQTLARERLSRYRGLKNIRTSEWSTEPDRPYQPSEWNRLLEIADCKNARNRVMKRAKKEAEKWAEAGVGPGSRVRIHLRDVPLLKTKRSTEARTGLLSAFGLLQHEHKRTVQNVLMTLPASSPFSEDGNAAGAAAENDVFFDKDGVPLPIKSKTPLVLQCGPRRMRINPVFSQPGKTRNDVHKFERYLHPGRTVVASFVGPLVWGTVPCVVFRDTPAPSADVSLSGAVQSQSSFFPAGGCAPTSSSSSSSSQVTYLCGGTTEPPSTSRVIAKRILLTGHPYKIHKRVVTVRYMFFNNQDVAWFKALPLRTLRGRTGYIQESLGTHGFFKAQFDGPINPLDAIGMSMYKRVWPRDAVEWSRDGTANGDADAVVERQSGSVSRKGKELADDAMMD